MTHIADAGSGSVTNVTLVSEEYNVSVYSTEFETVVVTSCEQGVAGRDGVSDLSPFYRRFEFEDALEWVVNHNMDTTSFFARILDHDGTEIYAEKRVIDKNSFVILLTESLSGAVEVLFPTVVRTH